MFDDILFYICLLNSLVEVSFNVINLRIAVDRRFFTTYPTFLILIAVHPFKIFCILDVLFIAYSARYSLFVLMCRKTHITHSLTLYMSMTF